MKTSGASKRKQDDIREKLESMTKKFFYYKTNLLEYCFSQEKRVVKRATRF